MLLLDENDFRVAMLRSILVRKIRKDRMMWKTEREGRKEGRKERAAYLGNQQQNLSDSESNFSHCSIWTSMFMMYILAC